MLKKTPHKRRIKIRIKQILFLLSLFCITFLLLFSLYILVSLKKSALTSPLGTLGKNFFHTSSLNDTTKKIEDLLTKNGITFTSANPAENNTTIVTLQDNQQVIFANSKDLEQQIASLQLIMRQLTIEGKRFNRIDFRFNNPVISF